VSAPDGDGRMNGFITVPAGRYVCRVAEVRAGTTRDGDERWSLCLAVVEGEHAGRFAVWDSIMFSSRGRARARLVLRVLGLPARGAVAIEPNDLCDRRAVVEIRPAEYTGPDGVTVRRNEVPYAGWTPCGPACGHSACSQHFIDTGDNRCVKEGGRDEA
jgi:hypothetical protein